MLEEQLKERLKRLETEREQLKATLAAYEGAIQECKHWMSVIPEEKNVQDNTE